MSDVEERTKLSSIVPMLAEPCTCTIGREAPNADAVNLPLLLSW